MTSRVLELARACGASEIVLDEYLFREDQLEAFAALIAAEAKAEGAAEQRARDVAICLAKAGLMPPSYNLACGHCADAIAAQAGGKEKE